jgi:hypothetical protein
MTMADERAETFKAEMLSHAATAGEYAAQLADLRLTEVERLTGERDGLLRQRDALKATVRRVFDQPSQRWRLAYEEAQEHLVGLGKMLGEARADRDAALGRERVLRRSLERTNDAIDTLRTCPICAGEGAMCRECCGMLASVEAQNWAALAEPTPPDPRDARIAELEEMERVLRDWLGELMAPWHNAHGRRPPLQDNPATDWPDPECDCRGCVAYRETKQEGGE